MAVVSARRTASAHLSFALRVHAQAAPNATEPACWSPYSVASALGLAATGARGDTGAELRQLLLDSPQTDPADLAEHTETLAAAARLDSTAPGEQPVLAVSNTLWADEQLPINDAFKTELAGWPAGAIRPAPLLGDPIQAAHTINADVADTTRGLIKKLIEDGDIDRDTVAVLVNALYLKTAWHNAFSRNATRELPFHTPAGTVDVPTMRLTTRLPYAAVDGWQVVALPAHGDIDALVLLPDAPLADAEPTLTADRLAALLDAPTPNQVQLALPKFSVDVRSPLTEVLRALGVRTMFGRDADFSGISDMPLFVDQVLHQAVLRVDESGLEGAAATAVLIRKMALARAADPIVLHVDRPFLLLVRHRATGVLYFMARVTNP